MGELSGKTAVVSGGSGGIGFAICTKFAQNGAKVIILDYNKETLDEMLPKLVAPEGQKHEGHFYDVTKNDRPPWTSQSRHSAQRSRNRKWRLPGGHGNQPD